MNNAGVVNSSPFLEKPGESIQRTVAVNLLALFWTMKAFLPDMVSRRAGHVVNMVSSGGLSSVPHLVDNCAAKFAVVGLTESLRQESKLRGLRDIRFTYVCPNTVATGRSPALMTWLMFVPSADMAATAPPALIMFIWKRKAGSGAWPSWAPLAP
ncbi:SDR family NAD(P)-dependent oxidoreductase [Candidatus Solincola sp.]|nr:SDR family NAD(P)-dependent oxidoreductase [Actinomycetota bacterium]MDI7250926.1 SDR family NAD(P)-dependent oxidoreductase [Actinomycetota bacterium]